MNILNVLGVTCTLWSDALRNGTNIVSRPLQKRCWVLNPTSFSISIKLYRMQGLIPRFTQRQKRLFST